MNKFLIGGAGAAAGIGLAGAAGAAYVSRMVQGRPTGDIGVFLTSGVDHPNDVIVFVGDSLVRGRAGGGFVDLVRQHFPDFEVVNAGVNGELAQQTCHRVDDIIACEPATVLVLIGTNDAETVLFPETAAARKTASLEHPVSLTDYEAALTTLVENLQSGSDTKVVLMSLPPLGQDLADDANSLIRDFNGVIRSVALNYDCAFIDLYASLAAALEAAGVANTKPISANWKPRMRSLTQHFVVGKSYEMIAEREGLLLSPDYVNLNATGAQIVADDVIAYLSPATESSIPVAEPQAQTSSSPPYARSAKEQPTESAVNAPRNMGEALARQDANSPYGA